MSPFNLQTPQYSAAPNVIAYSVSRNGDETEGEEKNLRDKEKGQCGEDERENCKVRGVALCRHTNVNPSGRGGGQRVSGGQPPSGLFVAKGVGMRRVAHTKLFNGASSQWVGGLHLLDPRQKA